MTHKSYIVHFFRKPEKASEKLEYLGRVELDDNGVNQHFTLQAKAFRQASPKCQNANRITLEQV